MLNRFLGGLRRRRKPTERGGFAIEFDRITIGDPKIFETDPVNLIRIFRIAEELRLPIHPDATRLITRSLKRITAKVRTDAEAKQLVGWIMTLK